MEIFMGEKSVLDLYKETTFFIKSSDKNAAIQFLKSTIYTDMVEAIYRNHFEKLSPEMDLKKYVEEAASIYYEIDQLNRRLNITSTGVHDITLIHYITSQFMNCFSEKMNQNYEIFPSFLLKLQKELCYVEHAPFKVSGIVAGDYIIINNMIDSGNMLELELLAETGMKREVLEAIRCGRKVITKDILYIFAIVIRLSGHETKKYLECLKKNNSTYGELTKRDECILFSIENMSILKHSNANYAKTRLMIANEYLEVEGYEPLSYDDEYDLKDSNVRKILITGANGFIGKECIEYFSNIDKKDGSVSYEICTLSSSGTQQKDGNIVQYQGSLLEPQVYERILYEFEVDCIIYLAAIATVGKANEDMVRAFEINVKAANVLCEVIAKNDYHIKSFIFPSSERVYSGEALNGMYDENSCILTQNINDAYTLAKHSAELLLMKYHQNGVPIIITRLSNIYGKNDHNQDRLIPKNLNELLNNRKPEVYIDGVSSKSAQIDLLYVGDLIYSFHLILKKYEVCDFSMKDNIIVNIGSGHLVSVDVIINLLKEKLGKNVDSSYIKVAKIPDRAPMDIKKFTTYFGERKDKSIEDGLDLIVGWSVKESFQKKEGEI